MARTGIDINVNFPDSQTGRSTRAAKMDIRTSVFFGAQLFFTKDDFLSVVVTLDEADCERLLLALNERQASIASLIAEEQEKAASRPVEQGHHVHERRAG